jgi:hypothetical protein
MESASYVQKFTSFVTRPLPRGGMAVGLQLPSQIEIKKHIFCKENDMKLLT